MVPKEIIINYGILDDTPPVYSPFSRSQADFYMYHENITKKEL